MKFGDKVTVYGQSSPGVVMDATHPDNVSVLILNESAPVVTMSRSRCEVVAE